MASYSKAQYIAVELRWLRMESPVVRRPVCLDAVLATPQGPLGSWEHFSVSRNKVLFEAHPALPLGGFVFIWGHLLRREARPHGRATSWGPGPWWLMGCWGVRGLEGEKLFVPLAFVPSSKCSCLNMSVLGGQTCILISSCPVPSALTEH